MSRLYGPQRLRGDGRRPDVRLLARLPRRGGRHRAGPTLTSEDPTREGWEPRIGEGLTVADVVEHAFDYRGDVTLVTTDGAQRVGYVFNRDCDAAVPFLQFFPLEGGDPETIPYAKIQTIKFTGKDTAAGNSYAAWLRLREAARSSRGA